MSRISRSEVRKPKTLATGFFNLTWGMNILVNDIAIHVWKSRCNEYEDLDDGGWAVPEKKQTGVECIIFWNTPLEL